MAKKSPERTGRSTPQAPSKSKSTPRAGRPHAPTDWRPATLAHIRTLIHQADPSITEDIKWRKPTNPGGVPVWSKGGLICTGETYKDKVKITFAQGAALPDPKGLFNASLDAGTRRAIDLFEGDTPNAAAFKALIRAAVKLNTR